MENKRKVIYIRHSNDTRDKHKYDEKLTEEGKENCKIFVEKLIKEHGLPDIIYYSPFHRTRQTKNIMFNYIKKNHNINLKNVCDYRLSRFFTEKQKKNPDIRSDTLYKGAPIDESWEEFKHRVRKQLKDMEKKRTEKIIWCITHTLVLSYVIKKKKIDHEYFIPYLDTIVITV